METISRSLLTFLLNSLWQIPLAAAVAALTCWFLRKGPAGHRHAVWVAALVASLLLPLASIRRAAEPMDTPRFPDPLTLQSQAGVGQVPTSTAVPVPVSYAPSSRTVSFAETTATVLLVVFETRPHDRECRSFPGTRRRERQRCVCSRLKRNGSLLQNIEG